MFLSTTAFTWFNGYHHAWLERERSGYIWGIVNIHAQVMAHVMRAVLSNSLREDRTSVTEGVNIAQLVPIQKIEKRDRIVTCLTSSLTAMTRSQGAAFHLLELDGP